MKLIVNQSQKMTGCHLSLKTGSKPLYQPVHSCLITSCVMVNFSDSMSQCFLDRDVVIMFKVDQAICHSQHELIDRFWQGVQNYGHTGNAQNYIVHRKPNEIPAPYNFNDKEILWQEPRIRNFFIIFNDQKGWLGSSVIDQLDAQFFEVDFLSLRPVWLWWNSFVEIPVANLGYPSYTLLPLSAISFYSFLNTKNGMIISKG